MWEGIESRIEVNERDEAVPLRQTLFSAIRESGLRPGTDTKKMVSFDFGLGDRLLWQIEGTAQHFYLHYKWQERAAAAGFPCKLFPYEHGKKDGGRHQALSREWSFGTEDCVQVKLDTASSFRRLSDLLQSEGEAALLNPAAVTRWIDRLRKFFPRLDRFDRPDPDFDASERAYKLDTIRELRAALEGAESDRAVTEAVLAAASKSNLLDWRTYLPLTPKGNADRARLDPALATLVRAALGPVEGHPPALEVFATAWKDAVPKGSDDAARQIGEFLFMHLQPSDAVYIRYSVRQDLWLEACGRRFPAHASMADTYADELRFMRAVRAAFEVRGLGPRDMIDIQSALWVVHNYSDDHDAAKADIDRTAVEAAMDAYDRFRSTGQGDEIFGRFDEPTNYWVRSSRERSNRVFPTKPLVGFILKKAELNGGWGQKWDAAARIHNAGFIIVDQDDKPVPPEERYDHLIRDADRIRLCALNYFIEPARERGASEVSIRAGDLAADMGLQEAHANVCQALGGEKFQKLARVSAPTHTEPKSSSSTIFTYILGSQAEPITVTAAISTSMPSATNLILFGPPGTGKTYATAAEAVRLCDGLMVDDIGLRNRSELMLRYKQLVDEKRIEFVTFHQTFSYEEFVEGLRPTTDVVERQTDAEGLQPAATSSGFRLKPHDGVFKRICERALAPQQTGAASFDPSGRKVFKMSLGFANDAAQDYLFQECISNGCVLLGWSLGIDWSDPKYESREEILATVRQQSGQENATNGTGFVTFPDRLRNRMKIGDVIMVSRGNSSLRAIGIVESEYYFVGDRDDDMNHGRKVRWPWSSKTQSTDIAVSDFFPRVFSMKSLYELDAADINWDVLRRYIVTEPETAKPLPHVLIIDEINRANISKVFGELITLLEPDKRLGQVNEITLRLPYSGASFGVPGNLHILGTMNTADRSIALLDTALRRRFAFRELMPNPAALPESVDGIDMRRLLSVMNERIEFLFDREHQIGHAYFCGCKNGSDVEDVMRDKVIPLLSEYFYDDWAKIAIVLNDVPNETGDGKFLQRKRLVLNGVDNPEGELSERFRWSVKKSFDFSEFAKG